MPYNYQVAKDGLNVSRDIHLMDRIGGGFMEIATWLEMDDNRSRYQQGDPDIHAFVGLKLGEINKDLNRLGLSLEVIPARIDETENNGGVYYTPSIKAVVGI